MNLDKVNQFKEYHITNIILELNETNFGHIGVIWKRAKFTR